MKMKELEIYIDGASSGNPGPAGIGVVILKDNSLIKNISEFIGITSNNAAEYMALIWALQEALIQRVDRVKINADSLLLVNQMNGRYKVRDSYLKVLYNQVIHLISGFKEVKISYIPRDKNIRADKLAEKAIKREVNRFKR
jgi:ribonuclease HI